MAHPTPKQLREIRENPDPALFDFVQGLIPGEVYGTTELWNAYNSHRNFCGDGATFRYALVQAGMKHAKGRGKMIRPEGDLPPKPPL